MPDLNDLMSHAFSFPRFVIESSLKIAKLTKVLMGGHGRHGGGVNVNPGSRCVHDGEYGGGGKIL